MYVFCMCACMCHSMCVEVKRTTLGVEDMSQQVRALIALPEDLCSMPRAYMAAHMSV